MKGDGLDIKIANTLGMGFDFWNHGFLVWNLDPKLRKSWALQGHEKKGDKPSSEAGFPGGDADCYRCQRADTKLMYGKGAGKLGFDASFDDIKDCLDNAKARRNYDFIVYNCNDWVEESSSECGLDCSGYSGSEIHRKLKFPTPKVPTAKPPSKKGT